MSESGESQPIASAAAQVPGAGGAAGMDQDQRRLHELGYAQELRRRWSGFSNFAVSFTIISILSGCLTLYGYGMATGGPVAMIWGWLIVGVLVIVVGLGMAEVCSSFPTAGGLYYWAAKLSPQHGPAWSWFTGWFNLVGQVAVTAGIDFGCALFLNAWLEIVFGFAATPAHTMLLLAGILFAHGLMNAYGARLVRLLCNVSVWWHILGVLVIVAVLAFVPKHHQSAGFVFGHLANFTGWGILPYVFFLGLLNAQYTFTGYDASAHMSEETRGAALAGPRGIVRSIVVSLIAGWILLLGVTFAIQHYHSELISPTGVPPAQIFIDAVGVKLAVFLLIVANVAQFYCGMASVTANSRMLYAFSRDGAVPFSRFWHHINPRSRIPTHAVWFGAVGAFVLSVPYLVSSVAYFAVTSIATIGLYVAYVSPVFLRLLRGRSFVPGPWHLGRWSRPIGVIATVWGVIIFFLFMLPEVSPVTVTSFNYTPVVFAVVLGGATLWWFASARRWFKGPRVQGSAEELAHIERELELLA